MPQSRARRGAYDHYRVVAAAPLLEWLLGNLEGYSRNKVKDVLQGRGIKVNGKTVTRFDHRLMAGDEVSVSLTKKNDRFRSRYVRLIYEDSRLVVIDKLPGVLSMPVGRSSVNVKSILDNYFRLMHRPYNAHVVHRLDRDTSGLMVYAKDMETEQRFEHDWGRMVYDRRYVALVSGEVTDDGGTISSWLKDDARFVTHSSSTDNGGKHAVTHFHTLERGADRSLLEFRLDTGRKNQIRVHAAEIGHPVCGDNKYGNGDDPIHRLALHAYRLCFYHPFTRERMEFDTDIPPEFLKALR